MVVTDSTGVTVCDSSTLQDDGAYQCSIAASAKAPLVITATHEDKEPLVSVVPVLATGTVNVNAATNMVAALLVNGDPADVTKGIAALIKTTPALASSAVVTAQQEAVLEIYKKLAPDAMVGAASPFTAKLTVDGKGMDAVFDIVKITVTAKGQGQADIAIETKVARDDVTPAPEPIKLALTGDANKPAPAPATVLTEVAVNAAKVTPSTSVAQGTTGEISALLARMTACYAQSQSDRVGTKTNASTAVAADIVSPTCKGLFLDSDPAKYKNDSNAVRGNQAFSGIFTLNTGLGVQFSQPNYEYTVNNSNTDTTKSMTGDVVFTAKWTAPFDSTDSSGNKVRMSNTKVDVYTARPDSSGKLFLTGNLSGIDANIEPRAEFRDFTHSQFSKYSYINTGYSVYINSKHGFGRVVVTTPNGKTVTLKQISGGGYAYMGLSKSSESTTQYTAVPTSVIRMAAAYIQPSTISSSNYCGSSSNHPRDIDSSLFWTCKDANTPQNWTDDEIFKIPEQGTWKFEAYTKWDDVSPSVTTYRRALRRPPTLKELELSLPKWPKLTDEMRKQMTDASVTTGSIPLSYDGPSKYRVATAADGNAWQIPNEPKWSPTLVKISGKDSLNGSGVGFDDSASTYSSWRKATIACSHASVSDQHCEMKEGQTTGNHRVFDHSQGKGAGFGQLQFNGYDARRVLNSLSVNMRKN